MWSQQVNLIILGVPNVSTEITLPAWRAQGGELWALNELMQMANLGRECHHGQDCSAMRIPQGWGGALKLHKKAFREVGSALSLTSYLECVRRNERENPPPLP